MRLQKEASKMRFVHHEASSFLVEASGLKLKVQGDVAQALDKNSHHRLLF